MIDRAKAKTSSGALGLVFAAQERKNGYLGLESGSWAAIGAAGGGTHPWPSCGREWCPVGCQRWGKARNPSRFVVGGPGPAARKEGEDDSQT